MKGLATDQGLFFGNQRKEYAESQNQDARALFLLSLKQNLYYQAKQNSPRVIRWAWSNTAVC